MRRAGLLIVALCCLAAAGRSRLAAAQTTPFAEQPESDDQPAAAAVPSGTGALEQELSVLYGDLVPVSSEVGDVGGGSGEVVLLPDGTYAWRLTLQGIQEMTKAHIHQGQPGEIGPVGVVLTPAGAVKVSGHAGAGKPARHL